MLEFPKVSAVLSRLLFHLLQTGLPESIPTELKRSFRISIYAENVAPWTRVPKCQSSRIRKSLQRALDAVSENITATGLQLSPTKSKAMMFHPNPRAQHQFSPSEVHG